jgi:cold-inducible RNA-binding protein
VSKKLYVGNLSFNTTEAQVQELFSAYGTVRSAQLINDRDTGRPKGFGFVEMGSDQEADAAAAALNGQMVDGRALTVNEAKPKESRPRTGGFGGGGGGYSARRY